jgi:hypothetical protein
MPTFNGSHKHKVSRKLFGYSVEYTDHRRRKRSQMARNGGPSRDRGR